MEYDIPDPGFDRIATLDIETTHYDPKQGEVVSVGIGVHDRGEPAERATYHLFHREATDTDDEARLIEAALSQLVDYDADGLVTYNGRGFDLDFLNDRVALIGATRPPLSLNTDKRHIDMMELRKQRCERTGEDWPSLEGCLEAYGLPVPSTVWGGEPLTNVRFGEELGPAYLDGLANGGVEELQPAVDHYLRTDLEANFAVFYSDLGEEFEPWLLDSNEEF